MIKNRSSVERSKNRSVGIIILGALIALLGALTIITALLPEVRLAAQVQEIGPLLFVLLILFLGVAELIAAIGLWRMTVWGWYLTIAILSVVFIGYGLLKLASGNTTGGLLTLLVGGVAVYWLLGIRNRFQRW